MFDCRISNEYSVSHWSNFSKLAVRDEVIIFTYILKLIPNECRHGMD